MRSIEQLVAAVAERVGENLDVITKDMSVDERSALLAIANRLPAGVTTRFFGGHQSVVVAIKETLGCDDRRADSLAASLLLAIRTSADEVMGDEQ